MMRWVSPVKAFGFRYESAHYVVLHGVCSLASMTGQASTSVKVGIAMPRDDYAVVLTNCTPVSYWTKMYFKLSPSGTSRSGFTVGVYNDAATNTGTCTNPRFMWTAICEA